LAGPSGAAAGSADFPYDYRADYRFNGVWGYPASAKYKAYDLSEQMGVLLIEYIPYANNPGGNNSGGGGGSGIGPGPGMGSSDSKDKDKDKTGTGTGTGKDGDGGTGVTTLPAKVLPRFTEGFEDGFTPLAAFNPDHIAYLYGYKEGDVQPDADIVRSHAAALIFRLLSARDKNNALANKFEFADWEWYTQEVAYLAKTGIISGYDDGTFRPDAKVTRAELVTMLARFDESYGPYSVSFRDIEGHWAKKFIEIGASNGWIFGYEDGTFKPDEYITRAEAVSIINRLLYRGIEIADIPDWAPSFSDLSASHWAYADIIEAASGHEDERKDNGYEIWTRELD
jgi:hypothetical protein